MVSMSFCGTKNNLIVFSKFQCLWLDKIAAINSARSPGIRIAKWKDHYENTCHVSLPSSTLVSPLSTKAPGKVATHVPKLLHAGCRLQPAACSLQPAARSPRHPRLITLKTIEGMKCGIASVRTRF